MDEVGRGNRKDIRNAVEVAHAAADGWRRATNPYARRSCSVPSAAGPLAATDLYQVLDTSDVPGGVINIVTGMPDELAEVLAAHDDVAGMWYFGSAEGSAALERLSSGNVKRTRVSYGRARDWTDPVQGEGEEFLRESTHIKNI